MTKKSIFHKLAAMLADEATGTPKMMDYKTTDGKVLTVSEDGTMATIDGQPATGSFTLEDGRTVIVENGAITSIDEAPAQQQEKPAQPAAPVPTPAPTPAPTIALTTEQKLAAAEAELAKFRAAKEQAEKAAAEAAEQEVEAKVATAMAEMKAKIKALESRTVGDPAPPARGNVPVKLAATMSPQAISVERDRTMNFMREFMPWVMQHYPSNVSAQYTNGPKMASILETNFNFTYPGILTTDIYYKPSLASPAAADVFTIDQDIKFSKRYNLINPISKILKPYTGCTRTFNDNQSFIGDTTVYTKEFQVSESWCKDDFTKQLTGIYNHLAQEWLKTGNDSFDPSGTPIQTIIMKVLADALRVDVFRRAFFAAGDSSDADYNQFDGLWTRLIDSSGGSGYCAVRAGSALGAGTLASGAALTALQAVYDNSALLLKNWSKHSSFGDTMQKPVFWVTDSVWQNYYASLRGTGAVTEQAFENLQKGLSTLQFLGYDVRPIPLWDQLLTETDNPLFATTRHLILFTTKDNHILGVESGSDLNKIDGWYERKDRKFYYESDMKMGYNYLHCDLQTIAY